MGVDLNQLYHLVQQGNSEFTHPLIDELDITDDERQIITRLIKCEINQYYGNFGENLFLLDEIKTYPIDDDHYLCPHIRYQEANTYWKMGNTDVSLALLNEYLEKDNIGFAWYEKFRRLLAIVLFMVGNVKQAINISSEIIQISQDEILVAMTKDNLGYFYRFVGNVDDAIQLHLDAIQVFEEVDYDLVKANCYENLAMALSSKNRFEEARKYLDKSLEIKLHIGNNYYTSWTLYHIIRVLTQTDTDLNTIRGYKDKFYSLLDTPNPTVSDRFDLVLAMTLKSGEMIEEKLKSLEILKRLDDSSNLSHEFKIDIKLFMMEIFIYQLIILEGNPKEITKSLNETSEEVLHMAFEHESFPLLIMMHIFRSKLSLLSGNYKDSKRLLQQAMPIVEEKDLVHLRTVVEKEISRLDDFLLKLSSKLEQLNDSVNNQLLQTIKRVINSNYIDPEW